MGVARSGRQRRSRDAPAARRAVPLLRRPHGTRLGDLPRLAVHDLAVLPGRARVQRAGRRAEHLAGVVRRHERLAAWQPAPLPAAGPAANPHRRHGGDGAVHRAAGDPRRAHARLVRVAGGVTGGLRGRQVLRGPPGRRLRHRPPGENRTGDDHVQRRPAPGRRRRRRGGDDGDGPGGRGRQRVDRRRAEHRRLPRGIPRGRRDLPARHPACLARARLRRGEHDPRAPVSPLARKRKDRCAMRTEVAIIGAGPAGLLLSHLLAREGVESVLVETRSRAYVEARVRAGILESSTVALLDQAGLGDRLHSRGLEHRGIYLQWPGERHPLDFTGLTGRRGWVYGQTELTRDLGRPRDAAGQQAYYGVTGTAVHDLTSDDPYVTFTDGEGRDVRLDADVIAGCDGAFGPSRAAVPASAKTTWERAYPYSWLGILADVAPSTDELIYAWHPGGFALHSMRSPSVSRLYLQVSPGTEISDWPDARIWEELAVRLGHGQDGWQLTPGPVTEKSILPMRSYVMAPMRYGRLFLAGDAAHIVPPTGAKGLNLAVADVAALAPALTALLREKDPRLADAYSATALRRVWRCTHFSWWMTTMLHTTGDPFDAELQLSQLRWVTSSRAGATGLAENYAGLPLAFNPKEM